MEEELQKNSDKGKFFSTNGKISAMDIVLYCELQTVVCMYYKKNKLSEQKFPLVSRWMESMLQVQEVIDINESFVDLISSKKLMFDIAGGQE